MSEQTINQIIPPVGVSNETLIGELSSYFRWNEEIRQYEINHRIDPQIATDHWDNCPSPVYDRLANPSRRPTVGEIITNFNNAVLREQRIQREFNEFKENAYKALEIIGDRLISESDHRGWCDEFDRIIDEVNESLPGNFQLPTRERDYEVEWTEYVTVQVSCSTTVRARNQIDAVDAARDEFDGVNTADIMDAIRYGNWEVDEYAEHDFTTTEV